MSPFRPKKALAEAKNEEKKGREKSASRKYAKLADYLMRRGKAEEALPLINRAIRLYPTAPRLYLEKAICEMNVGRDPMAEKSVEKFAKAALQRKKVRDYAPRIEGWLKDYPLLRERYYTVLLEIDRTDAAPLVGLARAHVEMGRLIEAQAVLVEALQVGGHRKTVVTLLRSVLERRNQMEGLFYLQRFEVGELNREELILLLTDPGHIPRRNPSEKKEVTLGTMIHELEQELGINIRDDRDKVIPLLKEFRARSEPILRQDVRSRIDMAVAYFEMDFVEAAIEEVERVSREHSLYWVAQSLLGEFLYRSESYLKALEVYKSLLRNENLQESFAHECMYKLAFLYFRLGDIKRAWEAAEHLKEINPEYRDLRNLRSQIGERISSLKRSA